MTDRPILFSAPMVRAILAGTKTQTRRAVRDLDPAATYQGIDRDGQHLFSRGPIYAKAHCPYGVPGDRLWVRESHWFFQDEHDPVTGYTPPVLTTDDVEYRADGESTRHGWRPSIHMPRWASRITLNITGVRVERLQAISREDAIAEGIEPVGNRWRHYAFPTEDAEAWEFPQNSFGSLWASINGAESWDANPWVWVVAFERAEA